MLSPRPLEVAGDRVIAGAKLRLANGAKAGESLAFLAETVRTAEDSHHSIALSWKDIRFHRLAMAKEASAKGAVSWPGSSAPSLFFLPLPFGGPLCLRREGLSVPALEEEKKDASKGKGADDKTRYHLRSIAAALHRRYCIRSGGGSRRGLLERISA